MASNNVEGHLSVQVPVHTIAHVFPHDVVQVKQGSKTNKTVFVRTNRVLLIYELTGETFAEVHRVDNFFSVPAQNANYPWAVYGESTLVVRTTSGVEVYRWNNGTLTHQCTVSKYHDEAGYRSSKNAVIFGNIFPSEKHIGIVSRLNSVVQFRAIDPTQPKSTARSLKKTPTLDAAWSSPSSTISLLENLDDSPQPSIALRTDSELRLFRYNDQYDLKELAILKDFPALDTEYDRLLCAKFDQTSYNDLLHFSTNGLMVYRYNDTVAAFQKLHYSTAFSKLRGWNKRAAETIYIIDINGDTFDEILYTGPDGLKALRVNSTPARIDLINVRFETTTDQFIRYANLKFVQKLDPTSDIDVFLHTSEGLSTIKAKYSTTTIKPETSNSLTALTPAEEVTLDPIPEIVAHKRHSRWLHDQLDLKSLLQPISPYTGTVELMIPLLDTPGPFGIPIRKSIQYKNMEYDNELGRGWTFPIDYILLDRQGSAFEQDHVYSLIKDNQRIILNRQPVQQEGPPSPDVSVSFTIEGYPDVKIAYYVKRNYWKVSIEKRIQTYATFRRFETKIYCPTWPLCGSESQRTYTFATRWYLNREEESAVEFYANYYYNLVKNETDIRLASIELSDATSIELRYENDRITEMLVNMMRYTQQIGFHYSDDNLRHLRSITQSDRRLFEFEYDQQQRLSKIIYPNGAMWTPQYTDLTINAASLRTLIPVGKDVVIYYGPDYAVIVDANLEDGHLILYIRDLLGGVTSKKTDGTETIYALNNVKRYLVHALEDMIVVIVIYDTCKDVAILQFTDDGWRQQKYYNDFPLDGIITTGNKFVLLYDQKTLRLVTISKERQFSEETIRSTLPKKFVVKAFPHGYATYDGKLEIFLLRGDNQWTAVKPRTQKIDYFAEIEKFLSSFEISDDLRQSIQRGLTADLLGNYRQAIVLKAPVLQKNGVLDIHTRFFTLDLNEPPSVCVYYTTKIPFANLPTLNYTVNTEENDSFVLGYRLHKSKYQLYVKKSTGPHAVTLTNYLNNAKKERPKFGSNEKAYKKYIQDTVQALKEEAKPIYKAVKEAVGFALDLSQFGMLPNQEGVLTGNHQVTYDGLHWKAKHIDDDTIRLRKVNRNLNEQYRIVKEHANDTFKIVSRIDGLTVFDTQTTKSEEIQLIAPYYAQAQPKDNPIRVYFFESNKTVTFPIEEKLNRASNQISIVSTLHANETSHFLLFRCMKYFLNANITVLGGQTINAAGGKEPPHRTGYLYDTKDLQLSVDGIMFRRIKIVPGADTDRFGYYEQSTDLQTGETTRKAFAADGREVVDAKMREQEEKRRQSERPEATKQSDLDRMILDVNDNFPIVDLGPYRLVDEMASYYGFEPYEKNHYGKENKWVFDKKLIKHEHDNHFLSLAQQMDTLTGEFMPVESHMTFVVSCWLRSSTNLQLGDTVDTLTVDVLVDKGERKLSSKQAEVKQRIGSWCYVETILDATQMPADAKLIFVIILAPSDNHKRLDVDHVRFSPLGMPFEASIYDAVTGNVRAVLSGNGLMKHYFYNAKDKKTTIFSEQGAVQEFTMQSKAMYAQESGRLPCVVEIKPRRSGWFVTHGMADITSAKQSMSKTFNGSWTTLALRFLYSQPSQPQGIRFIWQEQEFQLPCPATSSCLQMPSHGEVLIFISTVRVSVWLDGVLMHEQRLINVPSNTDRTFQLHFAGQTTIREFIEMYDSVVKVTYHNLSGQPTQIVEYEDPETVRIREILYDEIERPILQTKWTKVRTENGDPFFAYHERFIEKFDNTTLLMTGLVADLNPDCQGHPYTYTMYGNDSTENKRVQGLPGKDYTVNGKYKRTYSRVANNNMLSYHFPEKKGYHHKSAFHPGGSTRVTVEDVKGKKVARYCKVGNYEDRLSTWRYGKSGKIEQELPPMYHYLAKTSSTLNGQFYAAVHQPSQLALQKQWEVRYAYDDAKRVTLKRTPDGGIFQYLYDKHGILRFTLHKDHNETLDRVVHFTYIADDKVTREALVDLNESECIDLLNGGKSPNSTNFIETLYGEQDSDPNMRHRSQFSSRRIDDDQMTEYLIYDQRKRLLKKAFVVNTINTSYSIDYEYENDKLKSIKYPIGEGEQPYKFTYEYNGHGEVAFIRESTRKEPMFEFTYNADGMVETMKVRTDANHAFQRNFTYNEPGFLVKLEDDYLSETVSYVETDSYGQDSYTPIYEGLISKTSFTAHWQKSASPLRNGIYPDYFISKDMDAKRALLCHGELKRTGYLDENNLVNRTFYGERDDDLPFVCGNRIPLNHLSEVLSSRSFPYEYGHRYDYDDHDQLIKAKYFHGLDELQLLPLTHRTFSKEITGISEATSTKIWDVLRKEQFLTMDCTNPNLCHGREGTRPVFADFIQQHPFSHHLKTMLIKAVAERKALTTNALEAMCKRWVKGSNMIAKTCADVKAALETRKIFGNSADSPLAALSDTFKDALKSYKNNIPDIVRVLGHHFTTTLGRSAGDVQSYEIDANGNHKKFYTGFSRYRLEYREGTNQITKLHRQYFDREQRTEDHFNLEHNSDGAVVKAEHKGIKSMEYDRILHRVNKIEMSDGRKLLYQYDVRSERTFKQVLDKDESVLSEKYYIRDANGIVLVDMDMTYLAKDQPPDVRVTSYIYKDQQLVGFLRNDKLYGVITDHEGSVRLVVRDGEVVAAYDYLPYGQIFRRFGTDLDGQIAYLYTGQEWEPETGLYNYRARLYDPDIGRFYQMDPKEQYPSPYVYAGNSPVALIDPDGELAFAISCIIMAIIGAYIGASAAAQSWNPLQWNWKSTSLWLGLIGGALSGLSIPFNMTASVAYFVGLGLSLTTSISIMICSGITFGYFALAAASGTWDPRQFDFTSPGTWNALMGGIATSAFIVTNPANMMRTFRSITTALGRALFVTTMVTVTTTFAYLFTVVKMGGEFDATKWDFKDPGLYFSMFDAYVTASFAVAIVRNIPRNIQKWVKKVETGLDRLAETQVFFRARRLMKGDWSQKLSNAKYFLSANALAIANLQRGLLPIAFYTFIITLRMADSYEKSPLPGFSMFLQILKTAVTTRGFTNRVVKPLIPLRANVPLALKGAPMLGEDTLLGASSGAESLASFWHYLRGTFEWIRPSETHSEDDAVDTRDISVNNGEGSKQRPTNLSKQSTIENCYQMASQHEDNGNYVVSCYSHRSVVSIYPKQHTALLEPHDSYRHCLPLTYNGIPGISCDGEQSTLLALQLEPAKMFDYVDGWLLLARVAPAAVREGKRILKNLLGWGTGSKDQSKEPSTQRTLHVRTLQQGLRELQALSNEITAGGCQMEWIGPLLEDLREDVEEYCTQRRGSAAVLIERVEALRADVAEEFEVYRARAYYNGEFAKMSMFEGVVSRNTISYTELPTNCITTQFKSSLTAL
ncbi:uncharacterized protein LOC128723868 [Anopheles nili]|uniref:uncharacterized protein LOC128723868 n=1 Tax=Anopheles nili TaxID=185578 RepID=UPI00237B9BCC|nr:uncharacterized protein LOC128723868 [Anopheles nili]